MERLEGHTSKTGAHAAVKRSQEDHDGTQTHLQTRLLLQPFALLLPLLSVLAPPPILPPLSRSTRTLRPLFRAAWEKNDEEEGRRTSKETATEAEAV